MDEQRAEFWLFGYGLVPFILLPAPRPSLPPRPAQFTTDTPLRSLIWKPPPHYGDSRPGTAAYIGKVGEPSV